MILKAILYTSAGKRHYSDSELSTWKMISDMVPFTQIRISLNEANLISLLQMQKQADAVGKQPGLLFHCLLLL